MTSINDLLRERPVDRAEIDRLKARMRHEIVLHRLRELLRRL